jgi:hypothetical protein
LSEAECELRFQEHAGDVYEFLGILSFLTRYTLVSTGETEKGTDVQKTQVCVLMGASSEFDESWIVSQAPVEPSRVLYLNRKQEALVLDPFVTLNNCSQCKKTEVLLLEAISGGEAHYLSVESGHELAISTSNLFPAAIREAVFD